MSLESLAEAYGRAIVRHRGKALLLCLLLSLVSAVLIGLRVQDGIPVDFTPQALFMDEGEELERLTRIEAVFGREDNDVVLLVEGELATEEGIEALRAVHQAVEALPTVERVDSLVSATMVLASEGGLRVVRPLDHFPPAQAIAQAAADPALAGLLLSREGDLAAVRVRIDRDLERVAELGPQVDAVVQAARQVQLPAGMQLRATGVPFIRTEVVQLMLADELRFVPIVATLFALTTWALFRRFWSGIAPLFVTLVANLWALALLLAAGTTFNVLSTLVPILVVVIGASDGVHIVARYRDELHPTPDRTLPRQEAMGRTLRHMTVATFLTTFTTAAGFGSLAVARAAVIQDFGLHCAVAVLVAWVAVMLVLPTWLAFMPEHRVGNRLQADQGRALFSALDGLVARHPKAILLASLAFVLGAGVVGSGVRTQSHILEMYHPGHPTWEAVHQVDTRLSGIVPVFVYVEAPPGSPEGAILEPELLRPMLTLQDELQARPEIGWTSSPASWLRHIHTLLTGSEGMPASREGAAQELLLVELSGDIPLETVMGPDRRSGRILVLMPDSGGRTIVKLRHELTARAEALFAGTGAQVVVTGDGFLASAGLRQLVGDLINSVGLVLLVIIGTMWALLRDLRQALISALPNMVPLVFTLATLGLMGADIQVTNIVSFTVAIGLAVDDTIHFVARYREERAHGYDLDQAMTRTFHGAGRGIVLTSVLLMMGFGVLAFSELTSTRFFGILTGVTMLAALFADLLILPALLRVFGRREAAAPIAARPG